MLSHRNPARKFAHTLLFTGLVLGMASAQAAPAYKVTNGNDLGKGSLREALSSGASKIVIQPSVSVINIESTLTYNGTAPLVIKGSGQVVDGGGNGNTLLAVTRGADLAVSNLMFTDNAFYEQRWQGGGEGILLDVPPERTGVVQLKLTNVTVTGVGDHGVHVLDCDLPDCGAGGGGAGDGSPASIEVELNGVTIDRVGLGHFDADGLRVDERAEGSITLHAVKSRFSAVGADGVELDEGGAGDVILNLSQVSFTGNGAYCDGLPEELPGVNDSPLADPLDAACYDDGEIDLDDGFDVDEAGEGSIVGRITNALVSDNFDEGLDFDEAGDGGYGIKLVNIRAYRNFDEGIKLSAEDDGDLVARLHRVLVTDSDDDGVQIEQDGEGIVDVVVTASVISQNAKKDLKVEQSQDAPSGTLKVRGSRIEIIDTDNVDEI